MYAVPLILWERISVLDQIKVCLQYHILLYLNSGNKKAKSNNFLKVFTFCLSVVFSSLTGIYIFYFLFRKTIHLNQNDEIFLLHCYLFLLFVLRSFSLHFSLFDNKKDTAFFAGKPLKKYVRSLSLLLFTLYLLGISILPAIFSTAVFAAFRWSISSAIILFFSLLLVIPISVGTSGLIFFILFKLLPRDLFLSAFAAIRSCMRIIVVVMLGEARKFKGNPEEFWEFLPVTSNTVFFDFSSSQLCGLRIASVILWVLFFLFLYVFLVNINLKPKYKIKKIKLSQELFPVFTGGKKYNIITDLYRRIMKYDKFYKIGLYSNIGTLFSLPFLLLNYNLRFGSGESVLTFNSYFIMVLWSIALFSANFSECILSETPNAGWFISFMQRYKNENKAICNILIFKRNLFFIIPIILASVYFLGFSLNFLYTVFILVLSFILSFLFATNGSDNTIEPFAGEASYKIKNESLDGYLLLAIMPIIYFLYFGIEKYSILKIILPLFLIVLLVISFFRSIYGAKYIKNRWS